MNAGLRIKIFLLILTVPLISCHSITSGFRAEHHFQQGLIYSSQSEHERAVEEFGQALENRPGYPKFLICRSKSNLAANRLAEALDDIDRVIKKQPDNARAFFIRALIWKKDGNPEWAIEDLDRSIELKPREYSYYLLRAKVYLQINKLSLAEDDLDLASRWGPRQPLVYIYRGLLKVEQNDMDQAVKEFRRAIRYDPDNYIALFNLGNAYYRKEEYLNAEEQFNLAIKLNSKSPEAYYIRGVTRLKLGKAVDGFQDLRTSVELEKRRGSPRYQERLNKLKKLEEEFGY
jgi:tetratricopeptide (TPR) repeat protein